MNDLKDLVKQVIMENSAISRSDHDLLLGINAMVKEIVGVQRDHEKRIRILERILMYGVGALGAIRILWDVVGGLKHP